MLIIFPENINLAKKQREEAGGIRIWTTLSQRQGRHVNHWAIEDLALNFEKLRLMIAASRWTPIEP